jgi:hypothetical protein
MLVGIFGNLLTLIAIPYAKWRRRHEIHLNFWTNHIWVLHLALVELMCCILTLPVLFVFPFLGIRYVQVPGMDTAFRILFIIGHQMVYIDWLLLSIIVMTSVIKLRNPKGWDNFCENKIYVAGFLIMPWIVSMFYILPHFIQPSLDFGYHCLFGYPTYIPTGKPPLEFLTANKWMIDVLAAVLLFFLPVSIIIISYVVIWRHIRSVRGNVRGMATVRRSLFESAGGVGMSQIEIKFIWTVLVVCIFYLIASSPLAFAKMFRELRTPTSMLVAISLMLGQYSINFFIYSYHCKQYRLEYWDVILLVCPCLSKFKDKWESTMHSIGTSIPTVRKTTKNDSSFELGNMQGAHNLLKN